MKQQSMEHDLVPPHNLMKHNQIIIFTFIILYYIIHIFGQSLQYLNMLTLYYKPYLLFPKERAHTCLGYCKGTETVLHSNKLPMWHLFIHAAITKKDKQLLVVVRGSV